MPNLSLAPLSLTAERVSAHEPHPDLRSVKKKWIGHAIVMIAAALLVIASAVLVLPNTFTVPDNA